MGLDAPTISTTTRRRATSRSRRKLAAWVVDSLLRDAGGGLSCSPLLREEMPDDGRKYYDGPPHKWQEPRGTDPLGVA